LISPTEDYSMKKVQEIQKILSTQNKNVTLLCKVEMSP